MKKEFVNEEKHLAAPPGSTVRPVKVFVSEEILRATTKCEKDFSCLSGKRKNLCKILSCFDHHTHFILCLNESSCSYQHKIRERAYCDCPTRKEIYAKYKL